MNNSLVSNFTYTPSFTPTASPTFGLTNTPTIIESWSPTSSPTQSLNFSSDDIFNQFTNTPTTTPTQFNYTLNSTDDFYGQLTESPTLSPSWNFTLTPSMIPNYNSSYNSSYSPTPSPTFSPTLPWTHYLNNQTDLFYFNIFLEYYCKIPVDNLFGYNFNLTQIINSLSNYQNENYDGYYDHNFNYNYEYQNSSLGQNYTLEQNYTGGYNYTGYNYTGYNYGSQDFFSFFNNSNCFGVFDGICEDFNQTLNIYYDLEENYGYDSAFLDFFNLTYFLNSHTQAVNECENGTIFNSTFSPTSSQILNQTFSPSISPSTTQIYYPTYMPYPSYPTYTDNSSNETDLLHLGIFFEYYCKFDLGDLFGFDFNITQIFNQIDNQDDNYYNYHFWNNLTFYSNYSNNQIDNNYNDDIVSYFNRTNCIGIFDSICEDFNQTLNNYYNSGLNQSFIEYFNVSEFINTHEQEFNTCINGTNNNYTLTPTFTPTSTPTNFNYLPSSSPSFNPTNIPTLIPSNIPTLIPTRTPTSRPTSFPTRVPTRFPTFYPSPYPTLTPTFSPTLPKSSIQVTNIEANVTTSLSGILADDFVDYIFFLGIYESMDLKPELSTGLVNSLSGGIQIASLEREFSPTRKIIKFIPRRLSISDLVVDFSLSTQLSSSSSNIDLLVQNFNLELSEKVSSGDLTDKIIEVATRENVPSMSTIQVNNITVSVEVISTVISTNYPTVSPTPAPSPTAILTSSSNDKSSELGTTGVITLSVILGILGIGLLIGLVIKFLCGHSKKIHTDLSINTQGRPNGKIHPEYKITETRTGEHTHVHN